MNIPIVAQFHRVCRAFSPASPIDQALVLGIARLPVSAPAFVDSRSQEQNGLASDSARMTEDNTSPLDITSSSMRNVLSLECASAKLPGGGKCSDSTSGGGLAPRGTVAANNHASHESHTAATSIEAKTSATMITRAELASLLRASVLPVNDLQLLALTQLALLVPGPTATGRSTTAAGATGGGGGSTTSASVLPQQRPAASHSLVDPPSSDAPTASLSERERLLNTLTRHCVVNPIITVPTSTDASAVSDANPTTVAGSYRSSDPRVLLAVDVLRRDVERALVSATGSFFVDSGCFYCYRHWLSHSVNGNKLI